MIHSDDHEPTVAEMRADCRKWRRLVANCLAKDGFVPPATGEQYGVVYGRIVGRCRKLSDAQSLNEDRRQAVRQLVELLRPWSSADALVNAPRELVADLVQKEVVLEQHMSGAKRRAAWQRVSRICIVALIAGLAGSMLALIFTSSTGGISRHLTESLWMFTDNVASRVRGLGFAEQFVIAVTFSWLFGTWLIGHVRST